MITLLLLVACIIVAIFAYQDGNDSEKLAGKVGLCVSALFPIVGVIMYFVQNNKIEDATKYLKWAGIGFIVGLICNIIVGV